jgi:hypothetical protein
LADTGVHLDAQGILYRLRNEFAVEDIHAAKVPGAKMQAKSR